MISSKKILEALGRKAGKTLTRWYQQGLIPKPEVKTHPNGRGKMAFWDDWVLGRCLEIKKLLLEGQSLDEIKEQLGPLDASSGKHTRRYDPRKAAAAMERWERQRQLGDRVYEQFSELRAAFRKSDREICRRVGRTVDSRQFVKRVVELAENGEKPTLVVFSDRVELAPAHDVGALIAAEKTQVVMIVPLEDIVTTVVADTSPGNKGRCSAED